MNGIQEKLLRAIPIIGLSCLLWASNTSISYASENRNCPQRGGSVLIGPACPPDTVENFQSVEFDVVVASTNGANLYKTGYLNDPAGVVVSHKQSLHATAFGYGDAVQALGLDSYDQRWYKVQAQGGEYWIPAAWVYGDAPNTFPSPYGNGK
jgi:hypothetical protein